ncbi:uncharacterized protein FFB20_14195 [Fusarium fujikuroi]|uniref:Non-reducing end beta-L-arabinofuranosidase-like GH127 catalytic domain-containing protein n=1 Tax=Gibberella fujikuroi (strain CBS 195.34 / IMI 58289 / NRRL A-6831) TaxID=1279085 RepID=S0DKM6_GIBF5|nr:uncharacterized protein FFUJ_01573 [Fusarium fujikuroi IMI 58289]KLO98201.1 uncharacterized protein Y057_3108 [Fusarium fujikuroi]KLP19183.1 uncharacterized protein LW94_9335 [Fusarium fujikuroi]CCT61927.1 uncharacterized protein FFUJ_01573 [Fusarium fujikuroi IMI 58289]SCN68523.1 uncharacterized protein FFE2_01682 [Fusarium fujikuroi]SCN73063.1 uncharacterized protein FFC1_01676 [Fusarium fujikuroi]
MVDREMYLTGGISVMVQREDFGIDYLLPQGTDEGGCCAETCASIAFLTLAQRMLHLNLDSRYADFVEICLYNTIMTAMSLDDKSFTYINQLASSKTNKNVRERWFWCACCPPNLDGTIRQFGRLSLGLCAELQFKAGYSTITLRQKTDWPREGKADFK